MVEGFSAIFASFGFAILFNIRGKKLIIATIIGFIGGFTYHICLLNGYSQVPSLFIASIIISILSEIGARIMKCPVTIFLLCALIPLVPGGGMYYTMLAVVNNQIDLAIQTGVDTIVQACSIVIGCTLISSGAYMIRTINAKKSLN